jgi:hypothetical protein
MKAKAQSATRFSRKLQKPLALPAPSAIGKISCMAHVFPFRSALAALGLAIFAGCQKPAITTYIAPRDLPPPTPAAKAAGTPAAPLPELTWKLPAGWTQGTPGQMSVATFTAQTTEGSVTINITPLPNLAGHEEDVVNMWREQVGVGPLSKAEMSQALSAVEVAGGAGQSFEIVGTREGKAVRTITAFLHRDDRSWFFKLTGDDAAAVAQKAAFFEFVKSVRFGEAAPAPPATAAVDHGAGLDFRWSVPPAWQKLPAGQMQVAKFAVPEKDGAKAEVSVSFFPNDTGGTLANVNRWRGQLGLGPIDDAGLKDCTSGLDAVPGAVLVTLANGERQMLGAIVPRGERWWFYKMLGDASAVAAAREDFVRFASTQP